MHSLVTTCLGLLCLLGLAGVSAAPLEHGESDRHRRPETKEEHVEYLTHYGYCNISQSNGTVEEEFGNCVKVYQRTWNLTESGVVDGDTKNKMATPRCGMPDHSILGKRRKRYVLYGYKWPTNSLTYSFQNYSVHLPQSVIMSEFKRAFQTWMNSCNVSFAEAASLLQATIKVLFAIYNHGDGQPFDGPGGILAHTFFPPYGDVHFDDSETWTCNSSLGTNYVEVATHELGHALGLQHSNAPGAVMNPYYSGYDPNFKLSPDDISGCQALYGPPRAKASPPPPAPTPAPNPAPTPAPQTNYPLPATTTKVATTQRPRWCNFFLSWLGFC